MRSAEQEAGRDVKRFKDRRAWHRDEERGTLERTWGVEVLQIRYVGDNSFDYLVEDVDGRQASEVYFDTEAEAMDALAEFLGIYQRR